MSGANGIRDITIKSRGWPTPNNFVGVQLAPHKLNDMSRTEKKSNERNETCTCCSNKSTNFDERIETWVREQEGNQSNLPPAVNSKKEMKEQKKSAHL
ncbi:hypothetical protein HNO89_002237 [Sporosarcina luteola]|nr:hypothetical protein [Sporosarcina luteola]